MRIDVLHLIDITGVSMGLVRGGRRLLAVFTIAATAIALAPVTPSAAHGSGPESLYAPADPYISLRVHEDSDTADVLLAVQWRPTVDGTVNGVRICLDLTPQQVNARLPLSANLWGADGTALATGGAFEGIEYAAPCFYRVSVSPTRVSAGQTYVAGFWLRGGQYSYVPNGFAEERSNTTNGHLVAPSSADSTVGTGNGLYLYTSDLWNSASFPTESWENADYLVSPVFTPDAH
jgi:hypothetical protein